MDFLTDERWIGIEAIVGILDLVVTLYFGLFTAGRGVAGVSRSKAGSGAWRSPTGLAPPGGRLAYDRDRVVLLLPLALVSGIVAAGFLAVAHLVFYGSAATLTSARSPFLSGVALFIASGSMLFYLVADDDIGRRDLKSWLALLMSAAIGVVVFAGLASFISSLA